ncbi:MAG: transposase [Terriglobia bacterium]
MPRRARLAVAGVPWHIIQRGNNRSACFYADEDYRRYLDTLAEPAQKYGCAIHAYVLMTNIDGERLDQIRQATNGNYALGNQRFKEDIEQALKRRATPGKSGRPANSS